jgi:hypothetical protein
MQRKVSGTVLLAAAGGCVLASSFWLPGARSEARPGRKPVTPEKREAQFSVTESDPPVASAPPASFDRYKRLIEQNPFSPRLPKAAVPGAPVLGAPSSAPVLPTADKLVGPPAPVAPAPPSGAPPAPPAPPDPLKDWAYTGTVAIGADVYAVFENKASKQGRYLKAGDGLEGAVIDQVGQDEVALTLGGAQRMLSKSSAFNATPLNAAGGGGAPTGNPGAPGSPGGPGGPGAPGAPGSAPPNRPGGAPRPAGGAPVMTRPSPPPGAMSVPAGVEFKLAPPM